jgi:predicted DNA-binding transcriptional regulator AlpA
MSSRAGTRFSDNVAYPPRLMDLERAASYVGLGRTKFQEMIKAGQMPGPVYLDGSPRWDRLDLDRKVDDLKEIDHEAGPHSMIDRQLEKLRREYGNEIGLQRSEDQGRKT